MSAPREPRDPTPAQGPAAIDADPLRDILAAVSPALAVYARTAPGLPRFGNADLPQRRRLVLEAVYEGYLLHYGEPRLFEGMDADLRLLAGDALYALGLARLAAAEDVDAVAELADLISLSAAAHAEGRGDDAEALWDASASALGSAGGPGARAASRDRLPRP
jgi:hypothetical protein